MTILTAFSKEDITTEASYAIAWNTAKYKHPYTDGEFIKENILQAASILDLSNKKLQCLICHTALSKQTIVRRIGDLTDNVTMSLKNYPATSLLLV